MFSSDFYLKFVGENNMDGPGKWEECLGPGKRLGFDSDTLPIIIQRQQDSSGNVVFNVSKQRYWNNCTHCTSTIFCFVHQ